MTEPVPNVLGLLANLILYSALTLISPKIKCPFLSFSQFFFKIFFKWLVLKDRLLESSIFFVHCDCYISYPWVFPHWFLNLVISVTHVSIKISLGLKPLMVCPGFPGVVSTVAIVWPRVMPVFKRHLRGLCITTEKRLHKEIPNPLSIV